MNNLFKIIYNYFYKCYVLIFSVFFLIIILIIIWIFFIQNISQKEKQNKNKILFFFKKNVFYSSSDCLDRAIDFKYDTVIYYNLLKKQTYSFRNRYTIYHYSVLSPNTLLSMILRNYCIDISNIRQLIEQYPILENLKIGQIFSCVILDTKKIKYLIWQFSSKKIYIYNNINDFFSEGIIKILKKSSDGLSYTILFTGKINENFINSVRAVGLEENCVLDTIKALRNQLDFRKLRKGDQFSILTSVTINKNNNKKLQSSLIGARICTAGKDYYLFQLDKGKFYDRNAMYLENNFIQSPILEPYRISSKFNLNRLNPVTGQISPHAGVDFAVPTGTPVLAVGDGEVIISKYSKIAGNYIEIKHNYQCITRYMHLKKILVKPGQKVKKGDQIALSGNTGRSTGPHLHFEIWINRRPVNPLTTNFMNLEKLLGNNNERKQLLLRQIEKILPKLNFD